MAKRSGTYSWKKRQKELKRKKKQEEKKQKRQKNAETPSDLQPESSENASAVTEEHEVTEATTE